MTGQQLYNLHRAYASQLGIAELDPWHKLDWMTKERWESEAQEQFLRDRCTSTRKGVVSYDGPYAD